MKDDKAIEPLAYSPMEAARRLGVGRSTIYELIKSGDLAISKLGTRTLIHDESCRRVLLSHTVEPDGAKK
jgi:excisionase family DNA binding protein